MKKISLNVKDLPQFIELKNDNGDLKLFELKPAGKKFGAFLTGVEPEIEKLIYDKDD